MQERNSLLGTQDEEDARNSSSKDLPAYRVGARYAAFSAVAVLVVNIIVLGIAASRTSLSSTYAELWWGDCNIAARADTAAHLVINLFSTILLCGSNYCMQCLSAPTREEVDKAHSNHKWLDLGIPSFRNLRHVSRKKVILWVLIAVSSAPLHLMYNSTIYSSLAALDYDVLFVTPGFLEGDPFTRSLNDSLTKTQMEAIQKSASTYERLDKSDCLSQYAKDVVSNRSTLVIVTHNNSRQSSIISTYYQPFAPSGTGHGNYDPYSWLCSDPDLAEKLEQESNIQYDDDRPCQTYINTVISHSADWMPFDYDVDYCLSQPEPQRCGLHINYYIMIVVICCNLFKAICMFLLAYHNLGNPLLTVGDAVSSFLERPDTTTQNMCLADRWSLDKQNMYTKQDNMFKDVIRRQGAAVSRFRWVLYILLILISLTTISVLLYLAVHSLGEVQSAQDAFNLGFGVTNPEAIITWWPIYDIPSPIGVLVATVLIANLPQTILSIIYFTLNSLFTSMSMAQEWSSFANPPLKGLRVSQPKGNQRKKYFLQLPYRLAIPLSTLCFLLHWLVSQSFFIVVVSSWTYDDLDLDDPTFTYPALLTCGFSPSAIVSVLVVGPVVLIGTILWSMKKLQSTMPVAGANSMAISAACHPTPGSTHPLDIAEKRLAWGVMKNSNDEEQISGHCGFSDKILGMPIGGAIYV